MKLISLNIEGYKHIDSVRSYITEQRPDVLCLQEIYEDTFNNFKREFKREGIFTPMVKQPKFHEPAWGVAILTSLPIVKSKSVVYDMFTEDYPEFRGTRPERPKAILLTAVLQSDGPKPFNVACTHFTWSPNGMVTDQQKVNLKNLLPLIEDYPEVILCGDFNSPRGKEIFDSLAVRYHDNIPSDVTSTLDPNFHRAGQLKLVVDGLFSSSGYKVSKVKVVNHISDHCAIEANIILNS